MNTEKPLFSIVVPIFNEEQYIREALDSIVNQTDPEWEALLIDDGSTDATPGILDEYAEKDSRFRVVHKSNGGQSSAINRGVQESKGDWLCWLSGDDYFHPQKLEMNHRWIQDYPEIQFFFTGFWLIQPDGLKIEYPLEWLCLENPAYRLIQLLRVNWVMGISICIKRESWLKNGEFDGRLRYAHDLDMWVRLLLNTPNCYVPERTCTLRYHPGQETARFPLAPAFDSAKILIRLVNAHSFKELFPGVDLNDHIVARDMLNRTIDVAICVPDGNVYMQGIHPLVHLRILEWIWDSATEISLRDELRNIMLRRAMEFILRFNGTPFGLLWKTVFAALKTEQPHFKYFPCAPEKVGEVNYYIQRANQSEIAQPLRIYLEQNDNVSFTHPIKDIEKPGQLILLLPPDISLDDPLSPNLHLFREIWQELCRTGFSILIVGKSKYTLGLIDGLIYLGAENTYEQNQFLSTIGDFDTIVTFSNPERLKWIKAERRVSFNIPAHALSGLELSMAIIDKIQSTTRKRYKSGIIESSLRYGRAIYHFLVPHSVREKALLGHRLNSFRARNRERITSFFEQFFPLLKK